MRFVLVASILAGLPAAAQGGGVDDEVPTLADCADLGVTLLAGEGYEEKRSCEQESTFAVGDAIKMTPGGFIKLGDDDNERTCVHVGRTSKTYKVGLLEAPLQGGKCRDEDETRTCKAKGKVVLRCGAVRERAKAPPPEPPEPTEPAPGDDEPGTSTTAALQSDKIAVFVLEFTAQGVNAEAAGIVTDLVTARLADYEELEVLSGKDVADLLQLEATRTEMGCTEQASCLAELAGALGARYLMTGSVGRAERALDVTLSLMDTGSARVVGRQGLRARDLEDLAPRMKPAVNNTLSSVLELPEATVPEPSLGRTMTDGDTVSAASAAGFGAGAAGVLFTTVPTLAAAGLLTSFIGLGINTNPAFAPGGPLSTDTPLGTALVFGIFLAPALVPIMACGVVPTVAGLLSFQADGWYGYLGNWSRAFLVAGVALASLALSVLVALAVATVAAVIIAFGTQTFVPLTAPQQDFVANFAAVAVPWILTIMFAVAAAATGGAAGVAYDVGVGVFGDEPAPPEVQEAASDDAEAPDAEAARRMFRGRRLAGAQRY